MNQSLRCDRIVIGAGGAGLVAAATAAVLDPDRSIIVLEADSAEPCNTRIASNFIPACGTRFQRAAGIEDSVEQFVADIMKKNGGTGDPELTRCICAASAEALHWMVDALGVALELAPELRWIGHSAVRMHAHPSRGGPAVLEALRMRVNSLTGIQFFDRTRCTGLIVSDTGEVEGVTAQQGDRTLRIEASAVVLTCGGFGADPERVAREIPEMADAPHIGAKNERGDAIRWGGQIGVRLARMGSYQGRDCISADGTRVTPPVLTQGGIAVDRDGHRFVNELEDYSALARVYRRRPGGHAFFIWDQRIQNLVADVFVMQQAMARGGIVQAESIGELAGRLDLPVRALQSSVAEWNALTTGAIDHFGRPAPDQPLRAPFYAARITGAIAHTQGGLVVDSVGQVLRQDGHAIPGLYAGGNAIAGLSGDSCTGYLSGNGLLLAYTSGYLIGRHLASLGSAAA
jgi:fumarate reductase flavoprotein subunit